MTKSRCIRISDTVQFFPHTIDFPKITLNDRLHSAIDKIVSTLSSLKFQYDNPSFKIDNQTILAIQVIANMLHWITKKSSLPPPVYIPISNFPPNIHPKDYAQSLPRVFMKYKKYPYPILKEWANATINVQPATKQIINNFFIFIIIRQAKRKRYNPSATINLINLHGW